MKRLIIAIIAIGILISPQFPIKSSQPKVLEEVWNRRYDLQRLFPDKENGIGEMNGWTLTQWAEEFGWKEYKMLRQYSEEGEKDYIYEKYLPLERTLMDISTNDYDIDNYNCVDFTEDLQKELNELDIASVKIIGRTPNSIENLCRHEWIAIMFEPITGKFITVSDNYTVEELDE